MVRDIPHRQVKVIVLNMIALFARQVRVAFGHGVFSVVVIGNIAVRACRVFLFFDRRSLASDGQTTLSHFGVHFEVFICCEIHGNEGRSRAGRIVDLDP